LRIITDDYPAAPVDPRSEPEPLTARAHGLAGKTLLEEVRHGVSGTMPAWEIADVHVAPLLDMESGYGMPLMKKVLKARRYRQCRCAPARPPRARRPRARGDGPDHGHIRRSHAAGLLSPPLMALPIRQIGKRMLTPKKVMWST
jgi:hypothetical protein